MTPRQRIAELVLGLAIGAVLAGITLALLSACEARGGELPALTTAYHADTVMDPAGHVSVQVAIPAGQCAVLLGSDDLASWVLVSVPPAEVRELSVLMPVRTARRFVRAVAFASEAERAAWLASPAAPPPAGTLPEPPALLRAIVEIPPTTENPAAALSARPTETAAAAAGTLSPTQTPAAALGSAASAPSARQGAVAGKISSPRRKK